MNKEAYTLPSEAEVEVLLNREDLIFFVALIQRPGVRDAFETLEYTHYTPLTARSELLHCLLINWEELLWIMIGIPKKEKHLMKSACEASGLRIVDGIPTMFSSKGTNFFPYRGKNIFTLENKRNHPIYKIQ